MARDSRTLLGAALLVLALAVSAGCSSTPGSPGTTSVLPVGTLTIRTRSSEVSLSVEIARTPEARAVGLMHRKALSADSGMVFLFDHPTEGGFWMKDTLIPLSIAFWEAAGDIVAILDMEPCRAGPCPLHSPGAPYVGAVEVNRGWFALHGIEVGDPVQIKAGQ